MPSCHAIVSLLICGLLAQSGASLEAASKDMARDYLVHVWQTDTGLPQNWVSSLAQTPDGYLWIGTRYGGLARFDGVHFLTFSPQNTPALRDVQVERLSVDETGRLWVIMGNESITAFQDGAFQLCRLPRAAPRLRADHVLCVRSNQVLFAGEFPYLIRFKQSGPGNRWRVLNLPRSTEPDPATFTLDRNDTVWFVTRNQRLGRFADNRFEELPTSAGLPEEPVVALAGDRTRCIWVATRQGLALWDGRRFTQRTPTNGLAPENILQISPSGDGGLWVLEKNRLRKYLDGRWVAEASPAEFRPDTVSGTYSLHGDAQGNAWLIIYGQGLWHVKSDGSATLLTEKTGLPSTFLTCWFQDDEGDVWIGTAGGGIARVRESCFHALGQARGLPGKVVRSVCVDSQGELWAGTMSGGLARWQDGGFVPVPLPAPDSNPTESITVFPADDGGLWIGTLNHGLMRLDGGQIRRQQTPWGTIRVLFGDSRGRLWVGGLVGLFSLYHGRVSVFGAAQGFVDGHAIGAVAEDAAGALWLGTGPGDLWSYRGGRFARFTPPSEWPSVRFSAVLPDTNGVVWVGTLGGGLLRFRDGQFTRCRKVNGLPDDNVSQLLDSHDGYLWGGTYAGIFRVSKQDLEAVALGRADRLPCREYGRFDGLPALECSSGFQPSCWRAADGNLCFSTANGVVTVNPQDIIANRVPPKVIIEEMLVDGRLHELPARSATGTVTQGSCEIRPGRHYVQFRFTGLSFAAPDGVRFRVKLEGVDRDWQSAGGQRLIGYGPLLPGKYRFRVLGCNNDGVWTEQGATLAFTVLPNFWETWWFKAGLSLGTLGTLAVAVALAQRRRYRLRLDRLERQRAVERERSRIAQDLHDDLGTSLTQISMLSSLANRSQTSSAEARELIEQVRGRARSMVTALDEIVWAVNPKNDSLPELVNYLAHFAEEFFRPTPIRCRLEIPQDVPAHPLSAETRHHLFLAIKEALNNAARHSGATQVTLRAGFTVGEAAISVEDNGHGFQPDAAGGRSGNGLPNLRKRLEQIGGRAEVRSASGQGTTITFHLPLSSPG